MGEIVVLSSYRPEPYLTIQCDENHCHVMPVAYFRALAEGVPDVEPLPPCLVRVLVNFFLVGRVLDDE